MHIRSNHVVSQAKPFSMNSGYISRGTLDDLALLSQEKYKNSFAVLLITAATHHLLGVHLFIYSFLNGRYHHAAVTETNGGWAAVFYGLEFDGFTLSGSAACLPISQATLSLCFQEPHILWEHGGEGSPLSYLRSLWILYLYMLDLASHHLATVLS